MGLYDLLERTGLIKAKDDGGSEEKPNTVKGSEQKTVAVVTALTIMAAHSAMIRNSMNGGSNVVVKDLI